MRGRLLLWPQERCADGVDGRSVCSVSKFDGIQRDRDAEWHSNVVRGTRWIGGSSEEVDIDVRAIDPRRDLRELGAEVGPVPARDDFKQTRGAYSDVNGDGRDDQRPKGLGRDGLRGEGLKGLGRDGLRGEGLRGLVCCAGGEEQRRHSNDHDELPPEVHVDGPLGIGSLGQDA